MPSATTRTVATVKYKSIFDYLQDEDDGNCDEQSEAGLDHSSDESENDDERMTR